MSNKHIKIFSTSLAIRKMLIQTTVRFHYTPIRTAKIKSSDNAKCYQDVKLNRSYIAARCADWHRHLANINLSEDPVIIGTSWHLFQRNEVLCSGKTVYTNINCSFICNSQILDISLKSAKN